MASTSSSSSTFHGLFTKVSAQVIGRKTEIKTILAAMAAGKHLLLEGPPGTSKSTLLRSIAKEAGVPFYVIEGNIDLTPAKLVGHFNPAKVMADSFRPEYFEKGPLTLAMEQGGLLYIEEFNRMPADVSNVLISPMEEGEITIPRYGQVRASCPFVVIASQNPYDDVGTVRVSRAFMDRICRIQMAYQSEEEEHRILSLRTGVSDPELIEPSVSLIRRTREHPDIKLGASIRGGIDLVDLYVEMQRVEDNPEENFRIAAKMAIANKIYLSEMTEMSAEQILEELTASQPNGEMPGQSCDPHGDEKTICSALETVGKKKAVM